MDVNCGQVAAMADYAHLREIAESIAREAGSRLRDPESHYRQVREESAHDVKLRADTESETFIRALLAERTGFPVIGEEEGGDASLLESNRYFWVVDPLDGTYNYQRSITLCCVSIGLFHGSTPVLGVIHDFHGGECFSGVAGDGLRINATPVSVTWAKERAQAVLYTGFPSGRDFSDKALQEFLGKVGAYKKIRSLGSAALGLAWVAAGRLDAYYEEGVRLWDVAAGMALIQSAGGVVRLRPSSTGKFLAYDLSAAGHADLLV